MALPSPTQESFMPASNLQDSGDPSLPIFNVERVQLQFSLSAEFVAAQVANNVLVLALATGRILRIDLDNAADIDGLLPWPQLQLQAHPAQISTFRNALKKSA